MPAGLGARQLGQRQRRHPQGDLAGDPQRLAAGGQDAQARAGPQQRVRELGTRLDQVLAVVQHQQRRPSLEMLDQQVGRIAVRALPQPQRRRHGPRDQPGVAGRGQLHQPDAIPERLQQLGGGLERQAGLAGAARADQGHEPALLEPLLDLVKLAPAPHEAGQLAGQVGGERRQRADRRELGRQPRVDNLENPKRLGDVPEPMVAQIAQLRAGRQGGTGQLGRRRTDQHLPAVRGVPHPGAAVDGRPEVITVAKLGLAGVERHPHADFEAGRPRLASERLLDLDGGRHGVAGPREHGEDAVALVARPDHGPASTFDALGQQDIVSLDRPAGPHLVVLVEQAAPDDVGHQERHRSRWQARRRAGRTINHPGAPSRIQMRITVRLPGAPAAVNPPPGPARGQGAAAATTGTSHPAAVAPGHGGEVAAPRRRITQRSSLGLRGTHADRDSPPPDRLSPRTVPVCCEVGSCCGCST